MPLIHRIENGSPLTFIRWGAGFVGAGFALMPLAGRFTLVWITVLLWTAGEMLIFPLSSAWVAGRTPPGRTGSFMGVYTLTFSLSLTLGPAAGTWAYSRFGPDAFWAGAGLIGFLSMAGLTVLQKWNGVSPFKRIARDEPIEAGLTEV